MNNVRKVAVWVLPLVAVATGCSWFSSRHISDVVAIGSCVLEHDTLPPVEIAKICSIEHVQDVIDLLSAHKAAIARRQKLGAGPCASTTASSSAASSTSVTAPASVPATATAAVSASASVAPAASAKPSAKPLASASASAKK